MAVVELELENAAPRVLARTRRAGDAEDQRALGETAASAALDRGRADRLIAEHVEQDGEAFDLLVEDRANGLGRHIAPREAGPACGDDHVDVLRLHPFLHGLADRFFVVRGHGAAGERMAGLLDHLRQKRARLVRFRRTRVRDGQHGDAHGDEWAGVVDTGGH